MSTIVTSSWVQLIGGIFWGLLIDHFDSVVHSVCTMKQFRIWEREEEKKTWGRAHGGEERKKGREEDEKEEKWAAGERREETGRRDGHRGQGRGSGKREGGGRERREGGQKKANTVTLSSSHPTYICSLIKISTVFRHWSSVKGHQNCQSSLWWQLTNAQPQTAWQLDNKK